MGEIRKDYFRERYVIINSDRAKRPHDFHSPAPQQSTQNTPFSPGSEQAIPPIIAQYPNSVDSEWQFRVIPNKYAIVNPTGQQNITSANEIFAWSSNYGFHEIVIEGRQDNISFAQLGAEKISTAFKMAFERVKALSSNESINYVAYFKNEGREAGASINHPHSQIIATNIIPPNIKHLVHLHTSLRQKFGFSPLYKILDHERGGARIIAESKHFVALCPYASRYPMEVLIIPLRDSPTYLSLTEEERFDLAVIVHQLLSRLVGIGSSFNMEWIHAPNTSLHWHLSITPRLSIWAGYEIETNIIVNPIPPEHSASFYRGEE